MYYQCSKNLVHRNHNHSYICVKRNSSENLMWVCIVLVLYKNDLYKQVQNKITSFHVINLKMSNLGGAWPPLMLPWQQNLKPFECGFFVDKFLRGFLSLWSSNARYMRRTNRFVSFMFMYLTLVKVIKFCFLK